MDIADIWKKIHSFLNPQNLIIMLAASAFAPVPFTAILVVITVVLILTEPEYQKGLFYFKGSLLIPAFCCYALIVALFNKNMYGVILAPVFFVIFTIFCFVRKFITTKTFETCLSAVCLMVIPATLYAFIEMFTNKEEGKLVYRCTSYFLNANYFGALMAAAVIICAYKIVSSNGKAFIYYPIALLAVLDIYLSASLFAIVEVVVGVVFYLLLSKHYRLFCLMVVVGSAGIILITAIPELLPRLYEASGTTDYRVRIWGVAIREIMHKPLFGRGFLGYNGVRLQYIGSYETVHCHNLVIDSLLNFGIVGSALLLMMLYYILIRFVRCFKRDSGSTALIMIASIMLAAVSHMFTDITFFWIQTGLFYAIILGGTGSEERRLNIKNDFLIKGKYRI